MSNLTEQQLKQLEKFNAHQQSVKRASAKYYAKCNGKDYTDPVTGEIYEFSKCQLDDNERVKREQTKIKRQTYHKARYMKNQEKFKQDAKDYRLKKKIEKKAVSNKPLLLSEPVAV
jgi:hypothetical protein|tara:strand:+ start:106 stop:453 length:348 start_codon:yes stop_codon:yes gene_type:complete